ncbi:hypothetical protein [Kitasatospora sp. NPDC101183]|uniref:hypothetical protein n=1 Tax=Kitasatospora sp. NPDC101183 TaxID=3364100 RepID=UPI00381E8DDE
MSEKWDVPVMPYVDMTIGRTYTLSTYSTGSGIKAFALAFVGVSEGATDFTWAGLSPDPAPSHFKEEIDAFKKGGGVPVISFGGSKPIAPEYQIDDSAVLLKGYQAVIDGYAVDHINFDLEGEVSRSAVRQRNAVLVAGLLKKYPSLRVSYSLEVDKDNNGRFKLTDFGLKLLKDLHNAKVTPALVNALVEYIPWASAKEALEAVHGSVKDAFGLTDAEAWRHIGACPMYGKEGTFEWTLQDHKALRTFAEEKNLGCLSGWEAKRDAPDFAYGKIQAGYKPK